MSRVYWDSMLFIYWLEDHPTFGKTVDQIHRRMEQRRDELITSAFTFGEVLAGVHRKRSAQAADELRRTLQTAVDEVLPFTIDTADRYAQIRGALSIAPADAIHLACAAEARTDLFLTNDKTLVGKFVPGIQFIASLDTPLL